MDSSAELLSAPSDPLLRSYTATAALRLHLGTPVYNARTVCHLYFIYCLPATGQWQIQEGMYFFFFLPSLSLRCGSIHASQCSINLLLIRLEASLTERGSGALVPQTRPNKGSNWQVNLTVPPPPSLEPFLSHNYHFAPFAQV